MKCERLRTLKQEEKKHAPPTVKRERERESKGAIQIGKGESRVRLDKKAKVHDKKYFKYFTLLAKHVTQTFS